MSDTSTRSGMLWEVERILKECKQLESLPDVLLMENVPQIHNEKNINDFAKWITSLEEMGYQNYWQDLSATDYGIPQTRVRTFMVSLLGDYNYTFPEKTKLEKRLKDLLEDNVDEKYYLSDKCIQTMCKYNEDYDPNGIVPTLTTELAHHTGKNLTPKLVKEIEHASKLKADMCRQVLESGQKKEYDTIRHSYTNNRLNGNFNECKQNNISPTLDTRCDCIGVVVKDYLPIKNNNSKGWLAATDGDGIDISSRMEYHRGTVQKGKAQTITTMGGENVGVLINDR